MVYKYTSCYQVIGLVIRRLKMTDATFADDILIALREGLNLMKVRNMLVPHGIELTSKDNVASLPCDLVFIDGVFYKGKRLRLGLGVIDHRLKTNKFKETYQSFFVSDPSSPAYTNEQSYQLLRGADLKEVTTYTVEDFYIPHPNHFQTSFKEGCFDLFYRGYYVDKEGYPMIPDEENTRTALFWYVASMLCLSGYKLPDARMDYSYCEGKFKEYAKAAKKAIGYWSTDKKEAFLQSWVNLIPPQNYYRNFGIGAEQPKDITI